MNWSIVAAHQTISVVQIYWCIAARQEPMYFIVVISVRMYDERDLGLLIFDAEVIDAALREEAFHMVLVEIFTLVIFQRKLSVVISNGAQSIGDKVTCFVLNT